MYTIPVLADRLFLQTSTRTMPAITTLTTLVGMAMTMWLPVWLPVEVALDLATGQMTRRFINQQCYMYLK